MAESKETDKPDGAAFDNYFESLGKKAAELSVNEGTEESADEHKVVDEIESLCMNCHENGTTKLLLTRIPFFREIILMSFFCAHCNFKNAEIQSAGEIQQKGSRYELRLTSMADFARQMVKSDTCVAKFIEMDLEVPAGRGQLTNVEGLLSMVMDDLELQQPERKIQHPELFAALEEVIAKGRKMLAGESFPFRLSLNDPAGNSWIEPNHTDGVGKWSRVEYNRTKEQNADLGLGDGEDADGDGSTEVGGAAKLKALEAGDDADTIPNEVYSFPATCPGCTKPCTTHMKMVEIPHFAQVIIMSTVCDMCGYRSNEVKTGGEVPEKGKKITLQVENAEDLARDILKSESCALACPELELSVNPGTLGGRFTTVEGLLTQVRDDLHATVFDTEDNGFGGDGMESGSKKQWASFFEGIDAAIKGEKKFSIVLADPLASSYVQSLTDPEPDPQIEIEWYERTEEEEEDLGLRDMKTEDYAADAQKEGEGEAAGKADA